MTSSSFPWPCSNILMLGSLRADAINACFTDAGLITAAWLSTELKNKVKVEVCVLVVKAAGFGTELRYKVSFLFALLLFSHYPISKM